MKGTYYKTPIDFKALIEKRDLAKTTLETSVDQQLFLLATTAWGECKFDEFTIGGKEEGKNFPTLHKIIHQVKSWIRGIYDTIFNKLMKRIVERSPVSQSQLVCS